MSQNRPPPAYQEFAANTLSDFKFRMLSLTQRGMLWTMKMECWVNHRIPAKPDALARVLLCDPMEVVGALPLILPFFEQKEDWLICTEIEDYRRYLDERRKRQSEGGKKGADISNSKRPKTTPPDTLD